MREKTQLLAKNKAECIVDIYFPLHHTPHIKRPSIARKYRDKISTNEVASYADQLLNYYRHIISVAQYKELPFDRYSQNFWLSLEIRTTVSDVPITFDGYDQLHKMMKFEAWIHEGAPKKYHDIYQNWELIARCYESKVNLTQLHPDCAVELNSIVVPFDALRLALSDTIRSTQCLIRYLSEGIGYDVWSEYPVTPRFKVDTWIP